MDPAVDLYMVLLHAAHVRSVVGVHEPVRAKPAGHVAVHRVHAAGPVVVLNVVAGHDSQYMVSVALARVQGVPFNCSPAPQVAVQG